MQENILEIINVVSEDKVHLNLICCSPEANDINVLGYTEYTMINVFA